MPGEAHRIVFDCVVCAQAIINPVGAAGKCLELARDGTFSLCISDYLLTEIRELPGKLSPRLKVSSERVEQFILDLVTCSRMVAQIPEVFVLMRDPDDSHYINLAIAAEASLITSRDRDLLDLMDQSHEESRQFRQKFPQLRILSPEQLLNEARMDQ